MAGRAWLMARATTLLVGGTGWGCTLGRRPGCMSMLPVQGSRSELKAGLLAGRLRQRSLRAQRHRVLGSLRRTATAVLLLSIADPSPLRLRGSALRGVAPPLLLHVFALRSSKSEMHTPLRPSRCSSSRHWSISSPAVARARLLDLPLVTPSGRDLLLSLLLHLRACRAWH